MNISSSHLSTVSNATLSNVTESTRPHFHPSSTNTSHSPALDNTPPSPLINPTYTKPTFSPHSIDSSVANAEAINQENEDEPKDDTQQVAVINGKEKKQATEQGSNEAYSDAELDKIEAMKKRDIEVSAHERAHSAVGGQHAGAPSYTYKTGPDGVKYAVSGEVSIDTSPVAGDPQATLQKAQKIKAAALAPADPSAQDRKVAAKAQQMAMQARHDILTEINSEESEIKQASVSYQASVPEHFTGSQYLSGDHAREQLMSERNIHINHVYQNSGHVDANSTFKVQA